MSTIAKISDIVDDTTVKVKNITKKREVNITPEMEQYIDQSGTHCIKCFTETKDIESVISQVASRKKLGGTRDVVKSKCAYCNTNKNKFMTKSILKMLLNEFNFLKSEKV